MQEIDHSVNRSAEEVENLVYPHKCKCGTVIRHVRQYQVHHDCDAQ